MHPVIPTIIVGLAFMLGTATVSAVSAEVDCHQFAVTSDSDTKQKAVERSEAGLEATIAQWRFDQGWRSGWRAKTVKIEPYQPEPQPYWRFRVRPELFLKPDVKTEKSHTICWEGVISKAVCTSGAKVCT